MKKERQVINMRNITQCLLIFLLFFMTTVAVLEIDRSCRQVTGYGGEITASAEAAAESLNTFFPVVNQKDSSAYQKQ